MIAAVAAVVASAGDLMMLYVANSTRAELGLAAALPLMLWVGGLLGVVAIPFYMLGYRGVAAFIEPHRAAHARVIAGAGGAGSVIGAVIHGCTAFFIGDRLASGAPAGDPLAAITESPALVVLWSVATALVVAASVAFALAVRRGVPPLRPRLAWWNPAAITVALSLVGSTTVLLRSFLLPAAPNLAHVAFFAVCARASRRM